MHIHCALLAECLEKAITVLRVHFLLVAVIEFGAQ